MKRFFSLFCCFSILATANAQPALPIQEEISLKETAFNFGIIPQGKPVYHFFELTNTGKTPMVISDIQTTCGCTTPEWSKTPIPSGETTKIKVGYNAASEGDFEKHITIIYNQNFSKQVLIKGTVWKAPEGAAPPNASIQLLKQKNK